MRKASIKIREAAKAAKLRDNEPTFDSKATFNTYQTLKHLDWYNANKTIEDAAAYLGVKNAKWAQGFTTLAWAKRMMTRGRVFSKTEMETIGKMEAAFKAFIARMEPPVVAKAPTKVVAIQDIVAQRAAEVIAELEGLVDEYGIHGNFKDMNVYKWLVDREVKPAYVTHILAHFREQAKEPLAAAAGKDKELAEAYESYSQKRLRNLLRCYSAIIEDAERLIANKKVQRKPRAKKAVPASKRVAKLNYAKSDATLKLQSVDPTKIVGAEQLWVYNVKTRKLGVYHAESAAGLSVKGSTIEGFLGSSSQAKTLRKPEKQLPEVLAAGKVALRKVLPNIKAKPAALTGRINKDTILLRVV